MSRDWQLFFLDLIDFCDRIVVYTSGLTRAGFEGNQMIYDATVRNVELLGEAAKGVPEGVRAQMPDIPWREIISIRNVLAHEYFGVNNDVLWDVAQIEVPELLSRLQTYRDRIQRGEIS